MNWLGNLCSNHSFIWKTILISFSVQKIHKIYKMQIHLFIFFILGSDTRCVLHFTIVPWQASKLWSHKSGTYVQVLNWDLVWAQGTVLPSIDENQSAGIKLCTSFILHCETLKIKLWKDKHISFFLFCTTEGLKMSHFVGKFFLVSGLQNWCIFP